jgi:hypothetical protein
MSSSLYKKYNIVNNDWHLNTDGRIDVISIGELIKGLYIPMTTLGRNHGLAPYGNSKLLPFDVQFECDKLDEVDKIRNYYYRNIINPALFAKNDYRELNVYNVDAWNRLFPIYMTGVVSRRYVDAMMDNNSYVYSYVVFYQERLVRSSNVGKFEHHLIKDSVPLAVMHVTTLESEPIVCVDIIH